jgi:hypothetical protein
MYLQNRQFSNKHSEPTTICSCKTENKCTTHAHGQNEYSWEEEEEEEGRRRRRRSKEIGGIVT